MNIIHAVKTLPRLVDDALVARINRPLRAMPVLPRASIDDDVNVPESETPSVVRYA